MLVPKNTNEMEYTYAYTYTYTSASIIVTSVVGMASLAVNKPRFWFGRKLKVCLKF